MKIECTCGEIIRDQTDYLKNKGHLISDMQWFAFWNAVDTAIEKSGTSKKDKEKACMQLRKQNVFKTILECTNCGKLFIDTTSNGKHSLISYTPDLNKYSAILNKDK